MMYLLKMIYYELVCDIEFVFSITRSSSDNITETFFNDYSRERSNIFKREQRKIIMVHLNY